METGGLIVRLSRRLIHCVVIGKCHVPIDDKAAILDIAVSSPINTTIGLIVSRKSHWPLCACLV